MTSQVTRRHNVKSAAATAVDLHDRPKDFLTEGEVHRLLTAMRSGRHGSRDHCLALIILRHGLRVSEAVTIRISDIDLSAGRIWIARQKGSLSTEHPLTGDELRAIRSVIKSNASKLPWLFLSERGAPMTRQNVNVLISNAARRAGLGHVKPHTLRHTTGYLLANRGFDPRLLQDYLGHREPRHTARYTRTAAKRFEGLWD